MSLNPYMIKLLTREISGGDPMDLAHELASFQDTIQRYVDDGWRPCGGVSVLVYGHQTYAYVTLERWTWRSATCNGSSYGCGRVEA